MDLCEYYSSYDANSICNITNSLRAWAGGVPTQGTPFLEVPKLLFLLTYIYF